MAQIRNVIFAAGLASFAAGSTQADNWPQFRGPNRDGISAETGLLRTWPEAGPQVLWTLPLCEGYAGAAVFDGKVYINDYDQKAGKWILLCLSLADGKELWRVEEAKKIRRNHGITRTVPATDGKYVFAMDPKCVFHCIDVETHKEVWRKDLVAEYKTTIPEWYNGQCPLIEKDRVLIAPGGTALVVAFDKATGKPLWETPNPDPKTIRMSHASLMPAEIAGVRQYLYCTLGGPLGVSAADGKLLWSFPWKFNVAVPTSPLAVGGDKVFMTSCYEADTVMIQIKKDGEKFTAEKVWSQTSNEWNSEVHTPILWKEHLFAVGKKERGLFTCLDLAGKQVWTSREKAGFGLGGYIMADGLIFVLEGDTGVLRLLEANTGGYKELAKAAVLSGHDVWAPPALSDGRLLIRDMTKMVCLKVGAK